MTRFIAIILFFFSCRAALLAQDSVSVLSADDCVRIALDNATQVLKAKNNLSLSGVQLMAAYGQFLPDLSFGANYTFNGGKTLYTTTVPTLVDSRQNVLSYQLMSSLNIFNGFNDYAALKAASLSKTAAELNLKRVRQQISFDIAQAYLQVVLDRRIVEYAEQNLKTSADREAQLKELTTVGRKAVSDLYQQQAETSKDKLFLIQSQTRVKDDKVLLLRKMKVTDMEKYEIGEGVKDTLPVGPEYMDVNALMAKALHQRPDFRQGETALKIADWNIRQFRSGYYPKLNLNYGLVSNGGYLDRLYVNGMNDLASQTEPLGRALFGQVYGTVGLGLSWRIFDKFYTRSNVALAKLNLSNAQIDLDDLEVQIRADISQALNDYQEALQQIETSSAGLFAAERSFDVMKGKYQLGSANFIDLSNAQDVLLQAQVNRIQAVIKLALQKKIFDYLLGD